MEDDPYDLEDRDFPHATVWLSNDMCSEDARAYELLHLSGLGELSARSCRYRIRHGIERGDDSEWFVSDPVPTEAEYRDLTGLDRETILDILEAADDMPTDSVLTLWGGSNGVQGNVVLSTPEKVHALLYDVRYASEWQAVRACDTWWRVMFEPLPDYIPVNSSCTLALPARIALEQAGLNDKDVDDRANTLLDYLKVWFPHLTPQHDYSRSRRNETETPRWFTFDTNDPLGAQAICEFPVAHNLFFRQAFVLNQYPNFQSDEAMIEYGKYCQAQYDRRVAALHANGFDRFALVAPTFSRTVTMVEQTEADP